MIDLHAHILPGVDDGARSLEESLEMARIAAADGTRVLVATPHQRHPAGYHVTRPVAEEKLEEVRAAVLAEGIDLEIRLAAEIHFSEGIAGAVEEGELIPLSSSGRYFLFELPVTSVPGNIHEVVFSLQTAGCFPVLAHPERNFEVMRDASVALDLRDRGVLIQITAMSVTGGFGRASEKASRKLLRSGAVDVIASDAHNSRRRAPGLSAAVDRAARIVGGERAERMVTVNPDRILRGEELT